MIKVTKKEELKTKVYLEKDGTEYAIVVSNGDRVDGIYVIEEYDEHTYEYLLETKSIKKVFSIPKAILFDKLGLGKGELIVIDPAYGEV